MALALALVLVATPALVSSPALADEAPEERTLTKPYAGTGLSASCHGTVFLHPGGSACFENILGNEDTVDIHVQDDAGLDVLAQVSFRTGGEALASELFCTSIQDVPVPDQAERMLVTLGPTTGQAQPETLTECPPSAATQGTIEATFTLTGPPPAPTGSYSVETTGFDYESPDLDVIIVPPAHGPLVSHSHQPLPEGPTSATGDAYVDATLDAIDAWMNARDAFTDENPELSWLDQVTVDTTVIAQELLTPDTVQNADVLIAYPATMGPVLGMATQQSALGPQCIVVNTLVYALQPYTFSTTGMFNLAAHEFGHCLGTDHPHQHAPRHDVMSYEAHPQPDKRCPSNLDLGAIANAFASTLGQQPPTSGAYTVDAHEYTQYCPEDA